MRSKSISQGETFGRWTVLGRDPERPNSKSRYRCRCECGTVRVIYANRLLTGHCRSCGCLRGDTLRSMKGNQHPNWKGGKATLNGYVQLTAGGPVRYEHRVVMERKLGRKLRKGESVHHINGLRDDNRPENLELWAKYQPAGQRVTDKCDWAEEILKRYEPEALTERLREAG
ncbi:HNH endonuclease signature motif containing protein [Alienimonas sp. DA493]|uniref:HNH endonuclease signature motif containing protein n=1 Tax=Alienimonas sp. DA493 TaxID=3373605 RepID=UPI0037542E67